MEGKRVAIVFPDRGQVIICGVKQQRLHSKRGVFLDPRGIKIRSIKENLNIFTWREWRQDFFHHFCLGVDQANDFHESNHKYTSMNY
mmetsp:Transcript_25621/g.39423  ORF Transcript_25621/g.39423 Transcript_25621/m.39423 type:complete len:87 (+) Transcript_25621:331-591(+)